VAARAQSSAELSEYDQQVHRQLVPGMAAGRRLLRVFAKHPRLIHAAMATPLGWRAFVHFCRGELAMAEVVRRPSVRAAVSLLGG
jgi:hypothetical protein